ncbi:hypothetical protein EXIGLDRAFT_212144 [Exidia glandulosa HHB12029]|uniref:Uncharacterized protein n=1 Tax=Exidia glandulosa HHB12029 TaxID=1314781 RepID=A0A165EIB8_EXIGL|nr:hypothetical protein EXIGLDRAFT_212144 [Exidia glandulosa HHB12029]
MEGSKKLDVVVEKEPPHSESDAKRRRTDSDPDSTRARRTPPEDTSYDASKDSPRKRKPLPPQSEVLREARMRPPPPPPPPQVSPRPPPVQEQPNGPPPAPDSSKAETVQVQQQRQPPSAPASYRENLPTGPSGYDSRRANSYRGEQEPGAFHDNRIDDRVPSGPRADREPRQQPPALRNRRDSIGRRSDEQQRSPIGINGRSPLPQGHLQLHTGEPATSLRHNTRFGPPRSPAGTEWNEQQQQRNVGERSRYPEAQPPPQLNQGGPSSAPPTRPRGSGGNRPPRGPQLNISPHNTVPPPLPSLQDRMAPPPPIPVPVASQDGFYQNRGPPPSRSPHVSPLERNTSLPPSFPSPVQQRPPLASRLSGPDYHPQQEPVMQTQNMWPDRSHRSRGQRSRSFRSEMPAEGMQSYRSRSASPPRQAEQPSGSLHSRFQFDEPPPPPPRGQVPHAHEVPIPQLEGMHPDRVMALVQGGGPSRGNVHQESYYEQGPDHMKQRGPRMDHGEPMFDMPPPLSRKGSLLARLSDANMAGGNSSWNGPGPDGDVRMGDAGDGPHRRGGRMNGPPNRMPRRGGRRSGR